MRGHRRRRISLIGAFALVGIGITIGVMVTLGASYAGYYALSINPYIEHPEVDVDATHRVIRSEPSNDHSSSGERTSNNIQAPHTDVEYDVSAGEMEVDHIDKCFETNGMSMQPTFFTGNVVCGYEYDSSRHELKEGMIVTFSIGEDESTMTHRIQGSYDTTDDMVYTRGDNMGDWERVKTSEIEYIISAVLYK